MSGWNWGLVEYFDQRTDAINRAAAKIRALGTAERDAAYGEIRECVVDKLLVLSDDILLKATVSIVDDLYKFVNDTVRMDDALIGYLDAFARTAIMTVRARGFVARYVADNQFTNGDYLRTGPFDLFPRVFNAAGFVYSCPQMVARQLMQNDGLRDSEYEARVAQYIDEARMLTNRIIATCRSEARPFLLLDADYEDGSFAEVESGERDTGALTIYRNEAPVPGSNVSVVFPKTRIEG